MQVSGGIILGSAPVRDKGPISQQQKKLNYDAFVTDVS
jgi:hypothetical protein